MIQLRGSACFALEPFQSLGVFGYVFREDCSATKLLELGALGFVHYAHSTPAEFLDNRFSKHDWVVGLATYMRKRAESNYAMMLAMGNKNARKREIRKPKKQTPKQAPQRRDVNQIVTHNVKQPTGGG